MKLNQKRSWNTQKNSTWSEHMNDARGKCYSFPNWKTPAAGYATGTDGKRRDIFSNRLKYAET